MSGRTITKMWTRSNEKRNDESRTKERWWSWSWLSLKKQMKLGVSDSFDEQKKWWKADERRKKMWPNDSALISSAAQIKSSSDERRSNDLTKHLLSKWRKTRWWRGPESNQVKQRVSQRSGRSRTSEWCARNRNSFCGRNVAKSNKGHDTSKLCKWKCTRKKKRKDFSAFGQSNDEWKAGERRKKDESSRTTQLWMIFHPTTNNIRHRKVVAK